MKRLLIALLVGAAACSSSTNPGTGSSSTSGGATSGGATSSTGSSGTTGSSGDGPPSFSVSGSLAFQPAAAWGEYLSSVDGGVGGSRDAYVFGSAGNNALRGCSLIRDAGPQVQEPELTLDTILAAGTQIAPGSYDVAPSLGSHAELVVRPEDGGTPLGLFALSGSITFDRVDDARIAGSYSVIVGFPDGGDPQALSGTFDVPVCYQ